MEPTAFSIRLGRNLKNVRQMLGLSAEQLGKKVGLTTDAVYKYERGERQMTMEFAYKCAGILGCSMQDFEDGLDPRTRSDVPSPKKPTRVLGKEEHANVRWVATEWHGDVKALITMMTLVARFPESERRELYLQAEIIKDRLLRSGVLRPEDLPLGMEHMEQQLGQLFAGGNANED